MRDSLSRRALKASGYALALGLAGWILCIIALVIATGPISNSCIKALGTSGGFAGARGPGGLIFLPFVMLMAVFSCPGQTFALLLMTLGFPLAYVALAIVAWVTHLKGAVRWKRGFILVTLFLTVVTIVQGEVPNRLSAWIQDAKRPRVSWSSSGFRVEAKELDARKAFEGEDCELKEARVVELSLLSQSDALPGQKGGASLVIGTDPDRSLEDGVRSFLKNDVSWGPDETAVVVPDRLSCQFGKHWVVSLNWPGPTPAQLDDLKQVYWIAPGEFIYENRDDCGGEIQVYQRFTLTTWLAREHGIAYRLHPPQGEKVMVDLEQDLCAEAGKIKVVSGCMIYQLPDLKLESSLSEKCPM